jgi:hypothetical protein
MFRLLQGENCQIVSFQIDLSQVTAPTDGNIGAHPVVPHLELCIREYVSDSLQNKPKQSYSSNTFTIEPKGVPYVEQLLWISDFSGNDSTIVTLPTKVGRVSANAVARLVSTGQLLTNTVAQLCSAIARHQYVVESARLAGVALSGGSLAQFNKLTTKIDDIKNSHQYTMMGIEDAIAFDGIEISGIERSLSPIALNGLSTSTVSTSALSTAVEVSQQKMVDWMRRDDTLTAASTVHLEGLADTHGIGAWLAPNTPTWNIDLSKQAYIGTNPLTKALYEMPGSSLVCLFPLYLSSFTCGEKDETQMAELMRQFTLSIKKLGFSIRRSQDSVLTLKDHLRELVAHAEDRAILDSELDGWEMHRLWRAGAITLTATIEENSFLSDEQLRARGPFMTRPVYEWPPSLVPSTITPVPGGWLYDNSIRIAVSSSIVSDDDVRTALTRTAAERSQIEVDMEAHFSTVMTVIYDLSSKAANPAVLREAQIIVDRLYGLYANFVHECFCAKNGILVGGKY